MAWAVPAAVTTSTTIATSWGTQVRDNFTALDTMLAPASQAWTAFTVGTVVQSVTVTKTVTRAVYKRVGRIIEVHMLLSITSAGTIANNIAVNVSGLPAALNADAAWGMGLCNIYDTSAAAFYNSGIRASAATMLTLNPDYLGTAPSFALGSGDTLTMEFRYEAAS